MYQSCLHTQRGFSLLEVLLVLAILGILASITAAFLGGFSRTVDIRVTKETIRADLTEMRSRAVSGDSTSSFGARFVHPVSGNVYYELIKISENATTTALEKISLPKHIYFEYPIAGEEETIVFTSIIGTSASTTIIVTNGVDEAELISVTNEGVIK